VAGRLELAQAAAQGGSAAAGWRAGGSRSHVLDLVDGVVRDCELVVDERDERRPWNRVSFVWNWIATPPWSRRVRSLERTAATMSLTSCVTRSLVCLRPKPTSLSPCSSRGGGSPFVGVRGEADLRDATFSRITDRDAQGGQAIPVLPNDGALPISRVFQEKV
jgi:hypothetical protein